MLPDASRAKKAFKPGIMVYQSVPPTKFNAIYCRVIGCALLSLGLSNGPRGVDFGGSGAYLWLNRGELEAEKAAEEWKTLLKDVERDSQRKAIHDRVKKKRTTPKKTSTEYRGADSWP